MQKVSGTIEQTVAGNNMLQNSIPSTSMRLISKRPNRPESNMVYHEEVEFKDGVKSDRKVKKNRRRERKPKEKTLKSDDPVISSLTVSHQVVTRSRESTPKYPAPITEAKCRFIIKPVKKVRCYLFKKRNTKYKYINLKSFVGGANTCLFKTSLSKLALNLSRLSLKSPLTKIQRRKYPVEESAHGSSIYIEESNITQISCNNESYLFENVSIVETRETPVKNKKASKPKRKERRLFTKKTKVDLGEFPESISEQEALEGVSKNELYKGFLRVNPKSSRNSYVNNENSSLPDYFITSVADRNRALDGDEVVIRLKPQTEWTEGKTTAVVVHVLRKVHPRIAVGVLKPSEKKKNEFAIFHPRDKRIPLFKIPKVSWPNGFKMNPKLYEDVLFVAQLVEWKKPGDAIGHITESLGISGDLKVETISILKEFCLDTTPLSPDILDCLPKTKNIPSSAFKQREDIRKECVFTIDPITARDLDDALSVKKLSNGNYEVGVHISDASYYLTEGTELDKVVCEKATTIYLVDNVYHMLPVELCLHCSLLPSEDKLAFSVFWEMNEDGEIYNTRFSRTVLNSCTQLAYEHAQCMIDDPDKIFQPGELPEIYNGFTGQDLSRTVNVLRKIALNLRQARVASGALRIDQIKLLFSLNPQTGEPLDFRVYENKEAHRLIEEFMLLANISVAKKINETFPDIAFLRCHEPPKNTMLIEAQKMLDDCGVHVDISSSGSINSSMGKYITDDFEGFCRGIVLNHLFAKPMTRARYFCAGSMDTQEEYAHYALSAPIYTHFTSPIRRYADVMVHRLLAASLGYVEKPSWNEDRVSEIAANCNKQKFNAKRAGEASSDLYLAHYIDQHQPYIQNCVVADIRDRSFDAIVINTGSIVRVHQKSCEDSPSWKVEPVKKEGEKGEKEGSKLENEKKLLRLTLTFPNTKDNPEKQTIVLEIFTVVKLELKRHPGSYKLDARLLRPMVSRTFIRNTSNN